MHKFDLDDTIVAISTPMGEGGIGIVRLSGPLSIAIADKIFDSASGRKLSGSPTHTLHYGLGVFEGIRAYHAEKGTAIFRNQEHTDRLFRSAHIMNMTMSFSKEEIMV